VLAFDVRASSLCSPDVYGFDEASTMGTVVAARKIFGALEFATHTTRI
jgi:hypothetical protein